MVPNSESRFRALAVEGLPEWAERVARENCPSLGRESETLRARGSELSPLFSNVYEVGPERGPAADQ